jgi:hypothetical protein
MVLHDSAFGMRPCRRAAKVSGRADLTVFLVLAGSRLN